MARARLTNALLHRARSKVRWRSRMSRVPEGNKTQNKPSGSALAPTTIWIVAHEQSASSWRCWRGPRTAAALERELERERIAGRRVLIEIETPTSGPTEMSLPELCALGIVAEVAS
jgi:hypothetical protein